MSNTISYILLIILIVLFFLVMRRQATLKISRTIDDSVVVPITAKPSSGRFGIIPAGDFLPTMVDATKPFANATLNVHNPSFKYNPSTQTLTVPKISSTLTGNVIGNATTATDIQGGSCCKLLYQSGSGDTKFIDDTNAIAGYVLTSNGPGKAPSFQQLGGGGGNPPPITDALSLRAISPVNVGVSQPGGVFISLVDKILPAGTNPLVGGSSGLVYNPTTKQVTSSGAAKYNVYMNVQFNTINSVQTAYPKIRVNGVDRYVGPAVKSGNPWEKQFYTIPLTTIETTGAGQLIEVGVLVTQLALTPPPPTASNITVIAQSIITIQKI